jgi:hypothetical protein
MARLKTGPKVILIVLLVGGFVFGLRKAAELGWIPTPGVMKALVPEKATLPDVKEALVQKCGASTASRLKSRQRASNPDPR